MKKGASNVTYCQACVYVTVNAMNLDLYRIASKYMKFGLVLIFGSIRLA
jgi:hypothetical protein